MRRLVLLVALLAGLAGGGASAPTAQAGCAFIVVWHDRAYWVFGGAPAQASPGGTVLDGAMVPGCNDTVGAAEHPTSVAARSIPGIPPAVAIFSQGSTWSAPVTSSRGTPWARGEQASRSSTRPGDARPGVPYESRGVHISASG